MENVKRQLKSGPPCFADRAWGWIQAVLLLLEVAGQAHSQGDGQLHLQRHEPAHSHPHPGITCTPAAP